MADAHVSAVIVGGGIAGLVLALLLKKRLGIVATVVEQAPKFDDDVGGAIGLYPNGLRVIRDVDPDLLQRVRAVSQPFQVRRWVRHTGEEIAAASDYYLCPWEDGKDAIERASTAIRRWRLQKVLLEATLAAGIPVVFGQRLKSLRDVAGEPVRLVFDSGMVLLTDLVFGCDGVRSVTRQQIFGSGSQTDPEYTGYAILMGASPLPRPPGINFLSAPTTGVHAVFYPTGPSEQVFQIYFRGPERPETWRTMTADEGAIECAELARKLEADGWAESYLQPLRQARSVIRVGLRARDPLTSWHRGRVVLLGDAAHPPVPFVGQGAMLALEDAAVLTLLMQRLMRRDGSRLDLSQWPLVMSVYEAQRIPRATAVYRSSQALGRMQAARTDAAAAAAEEQRIREAVAQHGTLPELRAASSFDCQAEAAAACEAALRARPRL